MMKGKTYRFLLLAACLVVLVGLSACGGGGGASGSNTTPPTIPAPTITVSAAPQTIMPGQSTTLSWSSSFATSVQLSEGAPAAAAQGRSVLRNTELGNDDTTGKSSVSAASTSLPLSGSMTVTPAATTVYTIMVSGSGGNAQAAVTVTVSSTPLADLPTATISATPDSIAQGQSAILSWQTTHANSATLNGEFVGVNRSVTVKPTTTTSYSLVAMNAHGTAQAEVTVTVTPVPPTGPATATLSAAPTAITQGQTATLSWETTNASSVTLDGRAVNPVGTLLVKPAKTTTYTLVATGELGSAQAEVTIAVGLPPVVIQ